MHVDSGYHVVGMKAEDAPDIAVAKAMALEIKTVVTLYFARHGETEANVPTSLPGAITTRR
jgi:hypothetical protein